MQKIYYTTTVYINKETKAVINVLNRIVTETSSYSNAFKGSANPIFLQK